MNREHAEHILDAYLSTCYAVDADGIYPETDSKKARDSLREVILDAMSEYRSKPTTWPGITFPSTNTVNTVDGMAMAVGHQDGVVKVVDR